ncbi:MAG TPA: universal stress protein, partial [Thermomicrobiales bacterium]|nr:universal stress protein [Thermomicrobiales bacterium]
ERRAAEWRAEGIDAAAVVARGDAATVVAAAATRAGAGWIAMAGHGQGGLGGLALGGTALRIVQTTALPILLVAAPPAGGFRIGADAAEEGR